jgi:glycosyltransferase involved in cell wall biosynthesis
MNLVLITDTFPPLRTSGAIQLYDLSKEFVKQKHKVFVLVPSQGARHRCIVKVIEGVNVIYLKTIKTQDAGYIRRTVEEMLTPFFMMRNLDKNVFGTSNIDSVIWYSPSIFFGIIASNLKKIYKCKGYLIVRDIFPEWLYDMRLINRGFAYYFFKFVAEYQYFVADIIGIQSPGNKAYFLRHSPEKIRVLQNWLSSKELKGCSIDIENTKLKGRKICVYAGNMGVAQNMNILIDLAEYLNNNKDIGFVFVGRGSEFDKLQISAKSKELRNILFFDEIDSNEIPELYSQCDIGLITLDSKHKTHNIPGKFISYLQAGLPVIASVNANNDIVGLINYSKVGYACTDFSEKSLSLNIKALLRDLEKGNEINKRCKELFNTFFTSKIAAKEIISALNEK